jgi:hypothetical protein
MNNNEKLIEKIYNIDDNQRELNMIIAGMQNEITLLKSQLNSMNDNFNNTVTLLLRNNYIDKHEYSDTNSNKKLQNRNNDDTSSSDSSDSDSNNRNKNNRKNRNNINYENRNNNKNKKMNSRRNFI